MLECIFYCVCFFFSVGYNFCLYFDFHFADDAVKRESGKNVHHANIQASRVKIYADLPNWHSNKKQLLTRCDSITWALNIYSVNQNLEIMACL